MSTPSKEPESVSIDEALEAKAADASENQDSKSESTTPPESKENGEDKAEDKPASQGEIVQTTPQPPRDYEVTQTSVMNPVEFKQQKLLAANIIASKAAPSSYSNSEQVLMGILAGREMGMQPIESLQSLYIVNGSLNLWGKAVPKQIRRHGWKFKFSDESQDSVTCTMWKGENFKEPGDTDEQYTETYTFKEAQDSGYTTDNSGKLKFGWKPGINRKKKLRYGVLALILHTYIPEVLGTAAGIAEVSEDMSFDSAAPSSKDKISAALAANTESVIDDSQAPKPAQTGADNGVEPKAN